MKKKIRIWLAIAIALVWAGFAFVRIGSYAWVSIRDSIEAYKCRSAVACNDRLMEQWREKKASIRVGMTPEEVFNILGEPAARFQDTDVRTSLYFGISKPRPGEWRVHGLIPDSIIVILKDGVVSDTRMVYR